MRGSAKVLDAIENNKSLVYLDPPSPNYSEKAVHLVQYNEKGFAGHQRWHSSICRAYKA